MAKIGSFLAGIWFVAHGVLALTGLHFQGSQAVMSVLAIIAGAFLLARQ